MPVSVLLLWLSGCGASPPPAPGAGDAGPVDGPSAWAELPEEELPLACRPVIGARLDSVDPRSPSQWRAQAPNLLLRSDDEGRTWTRAPVDPAEGMLFAGPLVVAFASVEPLVLGAGTWHVSADRGQTWQPLRWAPTADPALPPGSLATSVGAARLAWTPTGRLLFALDASSAWESEPDAVLFPAAEDWHGALGEREWLADVRERSLYASRDWGRTWVKKPWRQFQSARLLGEQGLVATTFRGGLAISTDDGQTWQEPTGLAGTVAAGPADGEVWAMHRPDGVTPPRLMHSRDWGRSFAPVRVTLGAAGAVTAAEPRGRVWALADGRRVFDLELPGVDTLPYARMVCVDSPGGGALEQPSPARSDVPGTATLWARGRPGQALGSRQQVAPLAEPGRAYWAGQQTFPDAVHVTGVTRTTGGEVALLLQPVEVLRRDVGPAMFVRQLEPAGLAPTLLTRFDNLLELDGSGQGKFLEAHTLSALPDGTLRADTSEGNYPVGGATAMWAPWPGGGRWGLDAPGPSLVTREFVGATQYFRRSRTFDETSVFCDPPSTPTERCIAYSGHVADFGHRNGRLYVLDDWRGEVLEAAFANQDGRWRVVLNGLSKPSSLFVPLDGDPGLYVVDTHLYRFVPGPAEPGRRP